MDEKKNTPRRHHVPEWEQGNPNISGNVPSVPGFHSWVSTPEQGARLRFGENPGGRIPGESRGQTGRSPICDYVSNALRNKRETGLVRIGDRCFGSPAFSCGQDALHPFL